MMTPVELERLLTDIRDAKPGISDKEIAVAIGRSDQWLSDAKTKGIKVRTPAMALRWFLHTLKNPKCAR
jgi:hypothetical protein